MSDEALSPIVRRALRVLAVCVATTSVLGVAGGLLDVYGGPQLAPRHALGWMLYGVLAIYPLWTGQRAGLVVLCLWFAAGAWVPFLLGGFHEFVADRRRFPHWDGPALVVMIACAVASLAMLAMTLAPRPRPRP